MKLLRSILPALLVCGSHLLSAQWLALNPGTTQTLRTVAVADAAAYFAGGAELLIRSADGGNTWTNAPVMLDNGQAFTNFTVNDLHFFNATTGLAVGVKDQTRQFILRTTNGGVSWKLVLLAPVSGNKGLQRLQFIDNNTGFAAGDAGKIRKTTDGGLNWTLLSTTWPEDNYSAVDFVDTQRGYAIGSNTQGRHQFIKTGNGGNFWESVAQGDEPFTDLDMVTKEVGFLATDKVLYRIRDGHFTVDPIYTPDSIGPRRVFFRTVDTGYVLTPRTVRRSVNSGFFWEESTVPLKAGQELLDFAWTPDGKTGLVVGSNGAMYKTGNGGEPYRPMVIFRPDGLFFCKGRPMLLGSPAPATYNRAWYLDGALISNTQILQYEPTDYNTLHTLTLVLSNGAVSESFSLVFRTEPDPDYSVAPISFYNLSKCGGDRVTLGLEQTVPGVYYVPQYDGLLLEGRYGDGGPLRWTTDAYVFDTTLFQIKATRFTNCGTLEKTVVATANITPYPNGNLLWQPENLNVCYGNRVKIIVENSEIGVRYQLRESANLWSDRVPGNGGRLEFLSHPLATAGRYTLDAYNVHDCFRNLAGDPYITVTNLFLQVDTLHSYGVAGSPIPIENPESTLTAATWIFGPQAVPPSTQAVSPVVTYAQSGNYPFTYAYDSNVGCSGVLVDTMRVYPRMDAPGSNACSSRPLDKLNWKGYGERVIDQHIDRFGNRIIGGYWWERGVFSFDFDNFMLRKYDAAGHLLWDISAKFEDMWNVADDYRNSYAVALHSDSSGNIYVTGSYASKGVVIAGQTFLNPLTENKYYSQGFILKLDPNGTVLWKIHLTQPNPQQRCIPTDLTWGKDGRLYVALLAGAWTGTFADNTVVTRSNDEADAWLMAISVEGRFLSAAVAGLVSTPGRTLYGTYNPYYNPLISATTAIYPQIQTCPDGRLLFRCPFIGDNSVAFGGAIAEPLLPNPFGQAYHFLVAFFDPAQAIWIDAFTSHSVDGNFGSQPSDLLYNWPLVVDKNGDFWSGFSFNAPYSGGAGIVEQKAALQNNRRIKSKSGTYLFKYNPTGQLKWLREHTQMRMVDLWADPSGNCFAFGSYQYALAFQTSAQQKAGHGGYGAEDLFLAKLNPDGYLTGLRTWGTQKFEMPVRMTADRCGQLSLLSVDALLFNQNVDTAIAYTMTTASIDGDCAPDCSFAFEADLGDKTVCKGSEVFFGALVGGFGYQCRWQQLIGGNWTDLVDSDVFQGTQTPTLRIRPKDLSLHNQFFRCVVISPLNETFQTRQAKLSVRQTPDIQQQPTDVAAQEGQTAVFMVEPVSTTFVQYRWQQRARPNQQWDNLFNQPGSVGGATTKKLTLSNISLGQDQFQYRCVLQLNGSPCEVYSEPATLSLLTGVETPEAKEFIRLSPNPYRSGALLLRSETLQPARIALYNSLGQRLADDLPFEAAGLNSWSLQAVEQLRVPGVYWLQIASGGRYYWVSLLRAGE